MEYESMKGGIDPIKYNKTSLHLFFTAAVNVLLHSCQPKID